MASELISERLARAFCHVALAMIDPGPLSPEVRPLRTGWRELVWWAVEHATWFVVRRAGHLRIGTQREKQTWLETQVELRDKFMALWCNGPGDWVPEDLETAAALQILGEERKWKPGSPPHDQEEA